MGVLPAGRLAPSVGINRCDPVAKYLSEKPSSPCAVEPEWSSGHFMADTNTLPSIATHGAERLPSVTVDSYNVELKDDEGFIGDRASKGAFRDMIENWRKPLRKAGYDPFGDTSR